MHSGSRVLVPTRDQWLKESQEALSKSYEMFQKYIDSTSTDPDVQEQERSLSQEVGKLRGQLDELQRAVKERRDQLSAEHQRKVNTETDKALRLRIVVEAKKKDVDKLNERLSSQRSRALHHDGYFQVMDDQYNSDKLVKKFRQLYDQADIFCQQLEELWPDQQKRTEDISSRGPDFFKHVLLNCFEKAREELGRVNLKFALCLQENLFETKTHFAGEDRDSGQLSLLKELLRQTSEMSPSYMSRLTTPVLKSVRNHDLYKLMDSWKDSGNPIWYLLRVSTDHDTKHEEIVTLFIQKCLEVCWRLVILPDEICISDPYEGAEFSHDYHERHSLSNPQSNRVSSCSWPAVLKVSKDTTRREVCLLKAIVIT